MGIPLHSIELPEQPDMAMYEQKMQQAVAEMTGLGCTHTLFGDIFLEDLRRYREKQLQPPGITAIFPLWKRDTRALLEEFIALGFQAIIVCVNEAYLDKSFCGRLIDASFIADLPAHVDPCGEKGEYHSFVFAGPIFRQPIPFVKGILCTVLTHHLQLKMEWRQNLTAFISAICYHYNSLKWLSTDKRRTESLFI